MIRHVATALAVSTTLLLHVGSARAQARGVALEQFQPAPAGDDLFGVQSAHVGGHLVPRAYVLFDYAHAPLRVVRPADEVQVVEGQGFLHLGASLPLFDRLLFSVDFPLAVAQFGEDATTGGLTLTAPSDPQAGDLRIGARGRIFGEYDDPFQIALGGYFFVPTGPQNSFAGEGAVRGGPHLLLGGRAGPFFYDANAGMTFRGSGNSHSFDFGAGAGVVLANDVVQLGAELYGATALDPNAVFFSDTASGSTLTAEDTTNLEALFGLKIRVLRSLVFGLAGGPGMSNAIGTPSFRAVGSVAWSPRPEEPPKDRDGDGILDEVDACPDVKGIASDDPKKHGCPPPPDGDKDGVIDEEDACPTVAGVRSDDPKKNGCPPDRDDDGIIDAADACPDVKGVANDDPKKNGCPPDADGDGIIDAEDACPNEKGVADPDPKHNGCPDDRDGDGIKNKEDACPLERGAPDPDPQKNGCPKQVRVTQTEIVILQQVQFDTGKATIRKASDPLLDEVAGVMKDHPELTKIEVQGHTDNVGQPVWNKRLSQDRAESVVRALVARGIDASRLVPVGYGDTKPIADNKTAEGRQTNRRVQFVVLERKQ